MRIFIVCSRTLFDKIPPIQQELEEAGHEIITPISYDEPDKEEQVRELSEAEYVAWKSKTMRLHEVKIKDVDALLVLNFEKNGQPNYIGGATFLEMFEGWKMGKKLFLYNPIPQSMLTDEIRGLAPLVINGNLGLVT